eukprot:TRINITY_DN12899_c0_g1_i1.p1 TRINITY_DN12899_c0_g1~~TRINITY_DN12899_c0_g1_i1.p1  ORF type:complete len:301 (+),score=53.74 TRINITY_DN12899_c0_g1_i1:22-903(+)
MAVLRRPAASKKTTTTLRRPAASKKTKAFKSEARKAVYGTPRYWEARYAALAKGEKSNLADEWLLDFKQLEALLPRCKTSDVLDLGCGVSALLRDLRRLGGARGRLVGIDYSASAVALCKRRRAANGVQYMEMDARKLSFKDSSFDIVVDKATMDGQLCDRGKGAAAATAREVSRILRPGGVYMVVTWRGPGRAGDLEWLSDEILPALETGSSEFGWNVDIHSFEEPGHSHDHGHEHGRRHGHGHGHDYETAHGDDGDKDFGRLPNVFLISKSKSKQKSGSARKEPMVKQHFH